MGDEPKYLPLTKEDLYSAIEFGAKKERQEIARMLDGLIDSSRQHYRRKVLREVIALVKKREESHGKGEG